MNDLSSRWITTTEAAQRLGVKRATLYAYVSRGILHSERRPGQQESLFDRSEVDALAAASRPSGSPPTLLRFRSVATAVSSQPEGDLLYRRMPLADLVRDHTFEEAAALVMGSVTAAGRPAPEAPADLGVETAERVRTLVSGLPLGRRLPVAMQLLAAADPFTADLSPHRVRAAALTSVRAAVAALGPQVTTGRADVPALLLGALRGTRPSRADSDLMRVLLTALLDHGLTASTIAARVAASTRAGLHDCLCAAYAAMSGPLHGAAPIAARNLIDDPAPAQDAVAAAVRSYGHAPGFGHFLYPDGDPRAVLVLDAVWRRPGTTRLRRRVDALADVVARHAGELPNIDLASAAALHALRLPAEAGEVIFQVARSFGVTAHVLEEYAETPLRWRGREAIG